MRLPTPSWLPIPGRLPVPGETLVTGEAVRRACALYNEAVRGKNITDLEGQEFYGEYLAETDPMGSDKKNPVSHVAYGYATQVCVLNEDGTIKKMVAAHDVGKAINPLLGGRPDRRRCGDVPWICADRTVSDR